MSLVAADGILDGPVSGAAAEIALEVAGQVFLLLLVERGGRHHHAGGAESALESLAVQELLLHRVEGAGVAGIPAGVPQVRARPSTVVTAWPSARTAG